MFSESLLAMKYGKGIGITKGKGWCFNFRKLFYTANVITCSMEAGGMGMDGVIFL